MAGTRPITVTAAIIVRNGLFLICRRAADDTHALKWEFAGGKLEEGEEPPACLRRELQEELAIDAEIGRLAARFDYQYPGRTPIRLFFYLVTQFTGEPHNCVFEEIRWVRRDELPLFDFLAADRDLVGQLSRGELLGPSSMP